ncbi:MAG: hypothetical protein U9R19_15140 [Bacteroidota bacterium]|nr:hypothetical protein [Bacteroidota bacterium]
MKKINIILSIILIAGITSFSQRVLLEENVAADTIQKKWGKNLRHYGHLYLGFGFAASPANEGAEVIYGASMNFDFGYRYKFRVCNYYALGADLSFTNSMYSLKQDEKTKTLPDKIEHDKERIDLSGFKLELYQRFNFGKRGNHIGNYLDIGAYGTFFIFSRHYTMDKKPEEYPYLRKIEIYETGLNYIENMEYGLTTRIGNNRWVFFARYRMSDLFKTTENLQIKYPELPALQAGFEISIF